jgi:two-component system, chemotaxis family, protein-glutamate methylesterase/glutaminase
MSIADPSLHPKSVPGHDSIRVMIVDDAIVVRGLLVRWIEAEAGLQVVASLRSGREAIEQVEKANPDVVILDVDMPDIDGITALPLLFEKRRDLVVIMSSTLTRRNAEVSLRALSLGATDYIPKPESNREITSSASFRRDLIEKIRALGARRKQRLSRARALPWAVPAARPGPIGEPAAGAGLRLVASPDTAPAPDPAAFKLRPLPSAPPRILLIGASTGGPQALGAIVGRISGVIDQVPVLITQHMPPTFTTILAEILERASGRPVHEAVDGEALRAGMIYIAPGGRHLRVARHDGVPSVALDEGPQINFCKPAVDPMFSSAAETWGSWNLALILTGMGSDGTRGAADIVAAGGSVIAQDEETSVVWGMPGSVTKAGLCCAVLPIDQIAAKLTTLFCGSRS